MLLIIALILATAGTSPPLQVGVCVSAKGMDSETVSATRKKISAEMKSLGAVVLSVSEGEGCCTTPACLRKFKRRGASGLAEISILRFGSVVRINVRFFNTDSGKQVLNIKAKASAVNFPASASLKGVLKKGLQLVRPRPKPEIKKPVEEPITEAVMPPPEPVKEPRVTDVVERKTDTTWYWVGGSVAAGGAILAGVGIYMFTGPMQDALDRRDRARDSWILATDPTEIDRYRSEMLDQDDKASGYHTIGWVTTGVGTAMVVGGVLVMLLVPGFETPVVGPMALRDGGGIVLNWSFE